MSVDLDVAGSEDDAIARNFLVLPQVDDVSHLVKRVRLEILNVEKTTLPCACTLSLIQCHSVWGINWRTESLQGMFIFTLLDSTMSHLNWNVHLDIHALDHTRGFALNNWNLQGVCPVVLLVPETVHCNKYDVDLPSTIFLVSCCPYCHYQGHSVCGGVNNGQ